MMKSRRVHATRKDAEAALFQCEQGLRYLVGALDCFVAAGAPKTAARVRLAISSAKGAIRNAQCNTGDRHIQQKELLP